MLLKTYKGQRVVYMKKTADGKIRLKLENQRPGEPHPVVHITQAQWDQHGKTSTVSSVNH